jgi:hypothetical protein
MTKEELDAIRDRLDAASEGEWHYDSLNDGQDWTVFAPTQWEELAYDEDGREGARLCYGVVSVAECSSPQLSATQRMQNAELIAHAPTDLRALLAEVERLTAERDNALAKAAAYKHDWYTAKSEFGAARSKMLQHIQEAFRDGALQARDAAATEIQSYDIKVIDPIGRAFPVGSVPMQQLANAIRAIPLPVFNKDK